MGTLIRIRNACFSCRKSGVVSFFQDIEWKKVELYGSFGNDPNKTCRVRWFSGIYSLKKWRNMVIPENVEKNGVIAFSLCWFDSECTFIISVTIT